MSMQTDIIFHEALKADADIQSAVDGRIYNTAIPLPDDEADNVPAPYIVITFDGMNNLVEVKDERYEGDEDMVNIGVEIVHTTRDGLAALVEQVRAAIPAFFEEYEYDEESEGTDLTELIPIDYTLTAGGVSYDPDKPCYWLRLNYQCVTSK